MSEFDEPLPREHAACIVRANEVVVRIQDLQQQVDKLNLIGIATAASTTAIRGHPRLTVTQCAAGAAGQACAETGTALAARGVGKRTPASVDTGAPFFVVY